MSKGEMSMFPFVWTTVSILLISMLRTQALPHECSLTANSSLTLQQAINLLEDCNDAKIHLPSANHIITSQTFFSTMLETIEFVGVGNNVSVSCDYDLTSNYTWYFYGLSSVTLTNIHFDNCPRPLRIDTVTNVTIQNCSFRYFTEAVLDIFNCHYILIYGTIFEHNTGTGIDQVSYRGNSGAVAIGYNIVASNTSQLIQVSKSRFFNNSATANTSFQTSTERSITKIYTGRGGALALYQNKSGPNNLTVNISNCNFTQNYARSYGGGLYLTANANYILVERTTIDFNRAEIGGGGIISVDHIIIVVKCNITNNKAFAGGGTFFNIGTAAERNDNVTHYLIESTIFSDNHGVSNGTLDYGGALAISSKSFKNQRSVAINNCTFQHNSGVNGVVHIRHTLVKFSGQNTFLQNEDISLKVFGTLVQLSGEVKFINNNGGEYSALHLDSFAQLVFMKGLNMLFEGNSGQFGASILIETSTIWSAHTQLEGNPLCPFLYENKNTAPKNWKNVSIHFANNTAVLGSAIYMSNVDVCSWYGHTSPYINDTFLVSWPIWQIDSTNNDTGYKDEEQRNSILSIQTLPTTLIISNTTVRAWLGERFSLGITGLDEFDHYTTATLSFYFQPPDNTDIFAVFKPEVLVVGPDPNDGLLQRNFIFYYQLTTNSQTTVQDVNTIIMRGLQGTVHVQSHSNTAPPTNFILEVSMCPAGYELQDVSNQIDNTVFECKCQQHVPQIVLCENDQKTIVIKRGKWAVYVPSRPQSNMVFYNCPMGYCRCSHDTSLGKDTCVYTYSHSDPDLQCNCDRKGIVCGKCRNENKGVSALFNHCTTCSNAAALLIVALIIMDAVVILLLLLLDTPLPSWIYPFIFYIQMAPVLALNFSDSFMDVGKYLYFVGSASSFYFVWDFCLYGNMSSEIAYFLRYLPLIVGIVTCISVIMMRSWIYKKILKKSWRLLKYHGLWQVILLSYTHTVYTSMTILNCPSIITDTKNEQTTFRWYVNGEIECFSGGHIALALLAIIVLLGTLFILPFIVLVATGKLNNLRVIYFIQPLTLVYRDGWKWWASVELGRRFLLILCIVILPQNRVVGVMIVAVNVTVYGYIQPYKSLLANLLEIAVNINFLFLLLINSTSFFHDDMFTFSDISSNITSSDCGSSIAGIAHVSWLLMPVYYLPILGLSITAAVFAIHFFRANIMKIAIEGKDTQPAVENTTHSINVAASGVHKSWVIQLPHHNKLHEGSGFMDLVPPDS